MRLKLQISKSHKSKQHAMSAWHAFSHILKILKRKNIMSTRTKRISQSLNLNLIMDSACLIGAYMACIMSISHVAYFAISMACIAMLAIRSNGHETWKRAWHVLSCYDSRSLFSCWIDNMTCLFVMLNIACSFVMLSILPMTTIDHGACGIMFILSCLMFYGDMKR